MDSVYPPEVFGGFFRPSGEKQKHFSASNTACATGCNASGLFGKQ
jgi:hypothetical protein